MHQGRRATLISVSEPSIGFYVKVVAQQTESVCAVMDCREAAAVVPAAR